MAQDRKTVGYQSPFWGIFLVFLGIIFLLQTFDILPWKLWGTLWRFWPVLLIIGGFSIILRHRHPWLIATITIIVLAASLWLAIVLNGPPVLSHQ